MKKLRVMRNFWWMIAKNALQETFINRWANLLFFLGKTIRVGMSLLFLILLKNNVNEISGYTSDQVIVFFLVFQFLDSVMQTIYRGVYIFDRQIKSGDFDFFLSQPINPLFRALMGKPDINDAIFLIPTTAISLYLLTTLQLDITTESLILFLALVMNGILIGTAMHILVLSAGVILTEVQSAIWLYRDISRLGQFPVTIYKELLRFLLFTLVPFGIMITVPAQALINRPLSVSVPIAFMAGVISLIFAIITWKWSLKQYSSASS